MSKFFDERIGMLELFGVVMTPSSDSALLNCSSRLYCKPSFISKRKGNSFYMSAGIFVCVAVFFINVHMTSFITTVCFQQVSCLSDISALKYF